MENHVKRPIQEVGNINEKHFTPSQPKAKVWNSYTEEYPKCIREKRLKKLIIKKVKMELSRYYAQKKQAKRAEILKTRQEKLLKFRINYIPLCSDEDWEAMAAFYSKNPK